MMISRVCTYFGSLLQPDLLHLRPRHDGYWAFEVQWRERPIVLDAKIHLPTFQVRPHPFLHLLFSSYMEFVNFEVLYFLFWDNDQEQLVYAYF
jgi:hypothetical protein